MMLLLSLELTPGELCPAGSLASSLSYRRFNIPAPGILTNAAKFKGMRPFGPTPASVLPAHRLRHTSHTV